MTADIAKQRYTSSYDWIGGSDNNANESTRAREWNKWHGGDGDDYLKSSPNSHIYHGGNARDIIVGGKGNDRLAGGLDNDTLIGGGGDDTLIGDGGPDRLDSGGSNILTGGVGADMFAVSRTNNPGLDRVTDFSVAEGDKLQVNTQTQNETTLSEVGLTIAANSENNAHTDILFEGQLVMIVENLDYTLITDDSFFTYFEVV